MKEKLQKVLARNGLGSRREIETWITQAKVTVNGKTAILGDRADHNDIIRIDGRSIALSRPKTRVLLYHKPVGEICTRRDNERRKTVFDHLPSISRQRWVSVGRLDINTSGLLLFTNDGELANSLMHPSSEIEREYACRVRGRIDKPALLRLRSGVQIDGHQMRFQYVKARRGEKSNQWFDVVLLEGRYREVRRLWQVVGGQVSRLIRTRYGSLKLPRQLAAGHFRELTDKEIEQLKSRVRTLT